MATTDITFGQQTITVPTGQVPILSSYGVATRCEMYGASPVATAAENLLAIQSALDVGGLVTLSVPGVYLISSRLVIGDNTYFKLGHGVTIKLVGGTVNNMLVTDGFNRFTGGSTYSGTLTWTSGKTVSLAWTAHGLSKGDYVFIYSSTLSPSNFIGCFPVNTVTDADNVVLTLHRTPNASPIGTVTVIKANQNITVDGGTWDMDYPTNAFGSDPLARMAIVMGAVAHSKVLNVTGKNCAKYVVEVAGVFDFEVKNLDAYDTASDILKVYGPAVLGKVENVTGVAGDDAVSIQTKEPVAYVSYMFCWGDCQNIHVKGVDASTPGNICAAFMSVNEYCGGLVFEDISGYSSAQSGVCVYPGYSSSVMDDITVKNNRASGQYGLAFRNNGLSGTVNTVNYYDPTFDPDNYASDRSHVFTDTAVSINILSIYNMNFNNSQWPLSSGFIVNLNNTIKTLNFIGGYANFRNTTGSLCQLIGSVEFVNLIGITVGSAASTLLRIFAGTPTINVTGCDINSNSSTVSTNVACSVNLTGNRFNCGSGGIVRSNAAVQIKVNSNGNNYVAGALFANGSGTGLWEFYGNDLRLDVSATGVQKTVSGQYCFNTAAAAGTLTQNRLVTCNGTNWVQVDNSTKVY